MDKLSAEQRRKNMQAVRSSGSRIETILSKELWALGVRYRKNDRTVYGKPDFTLKRFKLAIFVDSEFWHGKDWETRKYDIKSNTGFWFRKIERNIQRDSEVNERLMNEGWKVLRFWGRDITDNFQNCIIEIIDTVNEIESKNKYRRV